MNRPTSEWLQSQAELAERLGSPPGRDAELERHRLVIRALSRPLGVDLQPDFAARMATLVEASEEHAGVEDWLTMALMLAMAVAGLAYVLPVLAQVGSRLHMTLPSLPWPLLAGAAASIVVAWALDRGANEWWQGTSDA